MATEPKKSLFGHWLPQGVVLAFVGAIATIVVDKLAGLNILNFLWKLLHDLLVVLGTPYALPLWVWLLLGTTLTFLLCLVFILNPNTGEEAPQLPEFYDFRALDLEGVTYRWKWTFTPKGWDEEELEAVCSDDKCRLLPDSHFAIYYYNCPVCGRRYIIKPLNEVKALIRHRIENKLYKQ